MSGYSFIPKPLPGARLNVSHPLARGLVGFWPIHECGGKRVQNVVNALTNGVTGDFNMLRPLGVFLHGAIFPQSSWISVPHHPSVRPTAALSLIVRIRTSQTTFGQPIRGASLAQGGAYGFALSFNSPSAGTVVGGVNAGAVDVGVSGSIPTPSYAFHEYALTYNGAVCVLYVNGRLVAQTAATGSLSYNAAPSPLMFGAASLNGDFYLAGDMAHVALWNRGLSATEVRRFYLDPYAMLRPRRGFAAAQLGSPFFFQRYVLRHA